MATTQAALGGGASLDLLIESVRLAQRLRGHKYSEQRLHAAQENLSLNLEGEKERLQYFKSSFQVEARNAEAERAVEKEIQGIEEDIQENDKTIERVHQDEEEATLNFRRCLSNLYQLDSGSLRQDLNSQSIALSPLFWRGLRQNQQSARALECMARQTENAEDNSATLSQIMLESLRLVEGCITDLEERKRGSLAALKANLIILHHRMLQCQMSIQHWHKRTNELEQAKTDQVSAGIQLMTRYVAPVLEHARLSVNTSKVRESVIDKIETGEPLLFLDPPIATDADTLKGIDEDVVVVAQRLEKSKAELRDIESTYTKDLYPFLIAHPRKTARDFRQKHIAYKKKIIQSICRLEQQQLDLQREGKKYGMWLAQADHDFFKTQHEETNKYPPPTPQRKAKADRKEMRKLYSPTKTKTMEQLEAALNEKQAAIEAWIEPERNFSPGIDEVRSSIVEKADEDSIRPSEIDSNLGVAFDESGRRLRERLVEKYKAEQAAMREELEAGDADMDSDSGSEQSTRCCC